MRRNLFVCGVARSGTSVAAQWLCSCSLIAIGLERYLNYWKKNRSFPPNAFESERFFNPQPGDSWYSSLDAFPDYYSQLRNTFSSATYVGDKVPVLWEDFGSTLQLFPDAKFIYLLRDPFSVAASWKARASDPKDATWGAHRDVLYSILEWNRSVAKIVEFFHSTPEAHRRVYILSYEKLINNIASKTELSVFLEMPQLSSTLADITVRSSQLDTILLTDIERALVQDNMNTPAVEDMQRILDEQRVFFLQEIKASQKELKLREWYHSADLKAAGIRYGETVIEGCNYLFRGRANPFDPNKPYIACIGSATTFGRFIKVPFSESLERSCSIQCLNLGIGGARIESFLAFPALVKILKGAALVIAELMSARGYSSPIFTPLDSSANGGILHDFFELRQKKLPYLEHLLEKSKGPSGIFVDRAYEFCFSLLSEQDRARVRDCLISQYFQDLRALRRILGDTPLISLLMTRNAPYQARQVTTPKNYEEWSGYHPHFVDESVLIFCESLGMEAVVSRSARGFPYIVRSWDNDLPAPVHPWQEDPSLNTYYPSQEMHDDACAMLMASSSIQALLSARSSRSAL